MRNARRTLLRAGASAIGLLAIPAISRAANNVRLKISHGAPPYAKMLAELGQRFSGKHPGTEVEFIANGEGWDPLLQNTFRGAIIGDLPDATWQSLAYTPILAKREISQPLDEFSGGVERLSMMGLSRPLIDATLVRGKNYSLPFGTTIPVVYYNMNLLKRAGFSKPELPESWDEIIQIGKQVASLGGKVNGGYVEYTATNAWMFQNILGTLGGRVMNAEQTDIAFNGYEGLLTLEILAKFGRTSNSDMTLDQARQAFNSGISGVHIRTASGINSVAKAASGQFELQVGQLPVPSPNGRLVGAGHGFFMFAKDLERQRRVWDFISFATGPDGQAILAKHTGYLPINMITLNDPKFLKQYFAENPYHRSIVERLPITGDQFSFPTNNTVKIADMMSEEMRKVVTQRSEPKQALAEMAEQTRKLL
ncbi:carbohydrate ABC transporter substrate-binding protein (CUT1 family) [Bradyrhizobium macuxiense]|uniref:sn-glycerol-3-phosphate-binding periplasmic protein UgpB n=1 Tax=Bradyrhizobium macuxiense TaxID=1755647 RepID=A0A560KVG7_9BRAD|nr:extracellular solute-binding protein [Bradyrhizobium macuxiense]TWB87246.1 carbohydrate ABC transporter substrate-binding protein (CUT1 family) [Bradyrhizobium macuxiense]